MKNLFNNVYFMSALFIASVAYVFFTIKGLTHSEEAEYSDAVGDFADTSMDALMGAFNDDAPSSNASIPPDKDFDITKFDWSSSPRRNPFLPHAGLTSDAPVIESHEGSVSYVALPQLSAIFINNTRRLAMIDNKVIGIGDDIDSYTVISIESDHVDITGPAGNRRLSLGNQNEEK